MSGALPMLEVRGVGKRFGATPALDDVSLEFHGGKIHCVLGENGAGKSTLGKIIGGIYPPDCGLVLLDGRAMEVGSVEAARRLGICMVFQELSLVPDLSVRANLVLGSEPHRHPFARLLHRVESHRVHAVLSKLNVHVDIERPARDLPAAQQQMVEVAKALIHKPRMIILDEPTAMLSAPDKDRLFEVLRELRTDGTALALITHHIEDVNALADHVSILRNGRLVDSFNAGAANEPRSILDRLSGRPVARRATPSHAAGGEPFIRIDGFRDRADKESPLEVARGEIAGLYGVAGCGADRVAGVLVGLGRSTAISATVAGVAWTPRNAAQARCRGLAYLPTDRIRNGLLPGRSIRENLNLSLLDRYAWAGLISSRRERAGTHAELTSRTVKYVNAEDDITVLSGGNQQKVLLARTLAGGRDILVLEDPTAGVDIGTKREIHDAIRDRARQGAAVVLLSNDLKEAIELADTLYTMYAGSIVHCYRAPRLDDQHAIVADVIGEDPSA